MRRCLRESLRLQNALALVIQTSVRKIQARHRVFRVRENVRLKAEIARRGFHEMTVCPLFAYFGYSYLLQMTFRLLCDKFIADTTGRGSSVITFPFPRFRSTVPYTGYAAGDNPELLKIFK